MAQKGRQIPRLYFWNIIILFSIFATPAKYNAVNLANIVFSLYYVILFVVLCVHRVVAYTRRHNDNDVIELWSVASKRLQLRTSNFACLFRGTVQTWPLEFFLTRRRGKGHMSPKFLSVKSIFPKPQKIWISNLTRMFDTQYKHNSLKVSWTREHGQSYVLSVNQIKFIIERG